MRNYVGMCKGICSYNLVYNLLIESFYIYKVQFFWCTFQVHFDMGMTHLRS